MLRDQFPWIVYIYVDIEYVTTFCKWSNGCSTISPSTIYCNKCFGKHSFKSRMLNRLNSAMPTPHKQSDEVLPSLLITTYYNICPFNYALWPNIINISQDW